MSNSDEPARAEEVEVEKLDDVLIDNDKKTKARLRTRGPYLKAHADW
jgi:hypothetical protein